MKDAWPTGPECQATIGELNPSDHPEVELCRLAAVAYIEAHTTDFHVDPDDDESALAIPDDVFRACQMLTARLFRRRQSVEGVAGFGDFGAVRVQRIDPDIEALLAQSWVWGIA